MRDRFVSLSKNNKVYIVPTRFGMSLFLSVLFMLMAGAAYGNNLVNLLGFFLAAIGFVTMIQTHNNVRNVKIASAQVEPSFVNGLVRLNAIVEADDDIDHHNLEIDAVNFEPEPRLEFSATLLPRSKIKLSTSYKVAERGRYKIARFKLSSVYPLGLFYSWSYHAVDLNFYVYPLPLGSNELPSPEAYRDSDAGAKQQFSGDDYREHRIYQPTDSARHVDWRAFARGRPLLTKRFDEGGPESILLDWYSAPQAESEQKLSQLSLWVDQALRHNRSFALQLPQTKINFGRDSAHAHRCWQELATFGKAEIKEGN